MSKGNGKFDRDVIDFPDLGRQLDKLRRGMPWGLVLLTVLVLVLAFDSFYIVEPEEEGVVLRFGSFVDTTEPGLHFKLPLVDQVYKVPVKRQKKQEFGFRTEEAGIRTRYSEADLSNESLMFTGDLNLADVEWSVQYRIVDPYNYLFRVREVEKTFHAMNESVMREVVGDRTINEVITFGRQEVASEVEQRLQELCDQYETGIRVDQVVLQNVNPPDPVKPSFNEVNRAEQEKDQMIKTAQEEYNKVIPRARGQAEQLIRQAEGYAVERVNEAEGDAARFNALYRAYREAPEVTRKRMYLETLKDILPKAGRKVVVDDEVRSMLPLLNLEGGRAAPGGAAGTGGGER